MIAQPVWPDPMTVDGTFETCRRTPRTSAYRGKPEVADETLLRPIGGQVLLILLQQMNAMTTSDDKAADRTKCSKLALAAGLRSRPCTMDDDISRKVLC